MKFENFSFFFIILQRDVFAAEKYVECRGVLPIFYENRRYMKGLTMSNAFNVKLFNIRSLQFSQILFIVTIG